MTNSTYEHQGSLTITPAIEAPAKLNCSPEVGLRIQFQLPGSSRMDARSSLSEAQREAAVALFERGMGDNA
ncbi:MAG TPA: hypothetical protein VM677_13675, partial [Actinokineospora sp.]|nr:hypothetical protein [Actinokineospora sp.]